MKLKLPSISTLWTNTVRVFFRFPLETLTALSCTIVWYAMASRLDGADLPFNMIKFIFIGNLAFTLLLAIDLYLEAHATEIVKRWLFRVAILAFCTVLFFWLHPNLYEADVYRIAMFAFAFHLLVSFAPFIGRDNLDGFWDYNKTLFLRILAAGLYSGVLFIGLAAALLTINGLFDVKIEWFVYMRLFAIVVAGFSTIFFLAGVPSVQESRTDRIEYPKGLRLFTQYVLIPLMTIYLAILLVYEVKIIIEWDFPKGMVSLLILGYAVFGILSLLLIYPIRNKEGFGWIKLFSKFFYIMMIPLVILLLLAVWKRISTYGITESRYILICLAGWLFLITIYFLVSKKQNIKLIPASLCALALLAIYGPQSAFSISRISQIARLKKLTATKNTDFERAEVVSYLVQKHGLTSIKEFTNVDLEAIESKIAMSDSSNAYATKYKLVDTAYQILNIKANGSGIAVKYVTIIQRKVATALNGYQYFIPIDSYETIVESSIDGIPFVLTKDAIRNKLIVTIGINKKVVDINLAPMMNSLQQSFKQGKLVKTVEANQAYYFPDNFEISVKAFEKYELVFKPVTISCMIGVGKISLSDYKGYLFVRLK
jgi:hypothetical protein